MINKIKYDYLRKFSNLLDFEKAQIEEYEQANGINSNPKVIEYAKKLNSERADLLEINQFDIKQFWNAYLFHFKKNENKAFDINNGFSLENIKPLIHYFSSDFEKFKDSPNLSKITVPSLDKGLLIIGGFGTGKSSAMKALNLTLQNTNHRFIKYTANQVVTKFESCENNQDKNRFYKEMTTGVVYIDDLTTEEIASNFGKINVFKRILEERYDKGLKTYISMNFHPDYPNNVEKALDYYGEKYGHRLYDRLFEMFNLIIFEGPSLRN